MMASAVYTEHIAPTDRDNRVSLSFDALGSVSPFPSPSSSFIPPPTPGAHEFAVKPPPAGRNSRKASSANIFKRNAEDDAVGLTNGSAVNSTNNNNHHESARSLKTITNTNTSMSTNGNTNGDASSHWTTNGTTTINENPGMLTGNSHPDLPILSSPSPTIMSPVTPTPLGTQYKDNSIHNPDYRNSADSTSSPLASVAETAIAIPSTTGVTEVAAETVYTLNSDSNSNSSSLPSSSNNPTSETTTGSNPPVNGTSTSPAPTPSKIMIPDLPSSPASITVPAPPKSPTTPSTPSRSHFYTSSMLPSSSSSLPSSLPSNPTSTSNSSTNSPSIFATDPSLISNRPAPPSPATSSRRISAALSTSSASASAQRSNSVRSSGRSSRPPSGVISAGVGGGVSRANSLRKSIGGGVGGIAMINIGGIGGGGGSGGGSGSGSPRINPDRQSTGPGTGSRLSASFVLPSPQSASFPFFGGNNSGTSSHRLSGLGIATASPSTPTFPISSVPTASSLSGTTAAGEETETPLSAALSAPSPSLSVVTTPTTLDMPTPTPTPLTSTMPLMHFSSSGLAVGGNALATPSALSSMFKVATPSTPLTSSTPRPTSTSISTPTSTSRPTSTSTSKRMSTSLLPALMKRVSKTIYIKIRDFAFGSGDERHVGLGKDVPRANRVGRMNRRLGAAGRPWRRSRGSRGSMMGSDDDDDDEEEEGDMMDVDDGNGWDGFRMGLGRLSWNVASISNNAGATSAQEKKDVYRYYQNGNGNGTRNNDGFPSRTELDRNFLDADSAMDDDDGDGSSESQEYFDAQSSYQEDPSHDQHHEEDEEEELYPGLYRAMFAFEPEGTAEMRMEEDQIVRVVGRGGGVGWAVVVVDYEEEQQQGGGGGQVKYALVPESYLEPVRLDWEVEQ